MGSRHWKSIDRIKTVIMNTIIIICRKSQLYKQLHYGEADEHHRMVEEKSNVLIISFNLGIPT